MSTFTNKQLGIGALGVTLTTTLYTATAVKAIVTCITLCNTAAVARAVTVKVGPGTKRALLSAHSIAAGDTLVLQLNLTLEASDTIAGGQDTGTDVEYTISGVEIS